MGERKEMLKKNWINMSLSRNIRRIVIPLRKHLLSQSTKESSNCTRNLREVIPAVKNQLRWRNQKILPIYKNSQKSLSSNQNNFKKRKESQYQRSIISKQVKNNKIIICSLRNIPILILWLTRWKSKCIEFLNFMIDQAHIINLTHHLLLRKCSYP